MWIDELKQLMSALHGHALSDQCTENSMILLAIRVKVHGSSALPHQRHTKPVWELFMYYLSFTKMKKRKEGFNRCITWFIINIIMCQKKPQPSQVSALSADASSQHCSASCFPRVHQCTGMCWWCAGVQTVEKVGHVGLTQTLQHSTIRRQSNMECLFTRVGIRIETDDCPFFTDMMGDWWGTAHLLRLDRWSFWLSFGWLMTEMSKQICYQASVSHQSQSAVGQAMLFTLMRHTKIETH